MILEENYTLSNGVEIPKLGLGTWLISNADVVQAVVDAVKIGYRHIDTAQAYGNESGVGDGIRASGVKRAGVFVTTKLAAEVKSYKEAVASIDQSLKTLGLDYIDMMLIHSPQPWTRYHGEDRYFEGNREAWKALEEAYKAGKLHAIGLSNFVKVDIDNILESSSVKVSVPQLSIRYDLQLGLLPLPKTANPEHMKDNADVDFVISKDDMESLRNMEQIKDYGSASRFPVYGR